MLKNKFKFLIFVFMLLLAGMLKAENENAVETVKKDEAVEENVLHIKEYRSQEMIELDNQIFSATVNTMPYLLKQYNEALNVYLANNNYDSDLIFLLANQYFLLGRISRANEIFSKDDSSLKNIFGSATTFRMMGENSKAIEKYNKAIKMDSSFSENYLGRGLAYRNIGEYNRAINDFETFININKSYEGYLALGDLYFYLKEFEKAEKIARNGIGIVGEQKDLVKLLNDAKKNK